MKPGRQETAPRPLPVAMAAVTVAGQCRERSPADLAVFGAEAARFSDRFVDRATGEAMLAEAVGDGVAERQAALRTGGGEALFRVALWRQRGGQRIRLLASFSHLPASPAEGQSGPTVPAHRIEAFGEQFRLPLAAVTGLAERLRRDDGCRDRERTPELAADILAASWRMMRLADDLVLLAELGTEGPPLRMSEVDVTRLARRVLRLARPMAAAAGVGLSHDLCRGLGPSVLADETTLWSTIENLIRGAVEASGRDGEVSVSCGVDAGDLVLSVRATGADGAGPAGRPSLGATGEMSAANGARLAVAADGDFTARLIFPKERCLNPI